MVIITIYFTGKKSDVNGQVMKKQQFLRGDREKNRLYKKSGMCIHNFGKTACCPIVDKYFFKYSGLNNERLNFPRP